MNDEIDSGVCQLVRAAMAPERHGELQRDLWPEMHRKLQKRTIHPSWFDWSLMAALMFLLFFFPEAIPGLLYLL